MKNSNNIQIIIDPDGIQNTRQCLSCGTGSGKESLKTRYEAQRREDHIPECKKEEVHKILRHIRHIETEARWAVRLLESRNSHGRLKHAESAECVAEYHLKSLLSMLSDEVTPLLEQIARNKNRLS